MLGLALRIGLAPGLSLGAVAVVSVPPVVPEIAWTPAMVGAFELWEAADAAGSLNAAGTQAAAGEAVATMVDRSGAGRNFTPVGAASTDKPTMGAAGDASPSGVRPVLFRDPNAMRTAAFGTAYNDHTMVALVRLKAVTGTQDRWLVGLGDSSAGTNSEVKQSSGGVAGRLQGAMTSVIETDATERYRLLAAERRNTLTEGRPTSDLIHINGAETSITATGGTNIYYATGFHVLGNRYVGRSAGSGALADFFGFCAVPAGLSRGNIQRLEGYLSHRAGLAAQVLPATHPYRTAAPTVPTGTTSTADWYDAIPSVARQTFMGGYIELQPDSFNGGDTHPATDATTDVWGFPYSLTPSEQARLRDTVFPGGGKGMRFVRFPLGFGYRGLRNIDGTSGLARNIGERFAGQNASIANLLANVVADGGGLMPEYWSPAPHWKTTGIYGGGYLWAGGSYPRSKTLASIGPDAATNTPAGGPTSGTYDPTQFAAQVELIATAMVNDLEYLHTSVAPVRGFCVQNEPDPIVNRNYGTCSYDSATLKAIYKSAIPKIRASAILSTFNGQPNTVLIHFNSWQGFEPLSIGRSIKNDTEVLSTGKTAIQEIWAGSYHRIEDISGTADYLRANGYNWQSYVPEVASFVSEFEYFDPATKTDERRCANTMLYLAHCLAILRAPILMPIIHAVKQLGQTSSSSNTLGYGLTKTRLPAPFGQNPATAGDADPTIGFGQFATIAPNWNASQLFMDNIPVGSVIRPTARPAAGMPANMQVTNFTRPDGKQGVIAVNYTAAPITLKVGLGGAQKTMTGRRYRHDQEGAPIAAQTVRTLDLTIPAYSGECWLEAA